MKKRVLSMLMALALCLTLLPVPAWAESLESGNGGSDSTERPGQPGGNTEETAFTLDLVVAKVGEAEYTTLAAAIDAAGGEEITLVHSFSENVVVEEDTTANIILGADNNGNAYWTGKDGEIGRAHV